MGVTVQVNIWIPLLWGKCVKRHMFFFVLVVRVLSSSCHVLHYLSLHLVLQFRHFRQGIIQTYWAIAYCDQVPCGNYSKSYHELSWWTLMIRPWNLMIRPWTLWSDYELVWSDCECAWSDHELSWSDHELSWSDLLGNHKWHL